MAEPFPSDSACEVHAYAVLECVLHLKDGEPLSQMMPVQVEYLHDSIRAVIDDLVGDRLREADACEAALAEARAQLAEARDIARDLWAGLSTDVKLQMFEGRGGWLPPWIRPIE